MEERKETYGREIMLILGISLIGGILRYWLRDDISGDYKSFLEPWYELIQQRGWKALGEQIGDYNLPYQTWILLMTCLPMKPLYAYKLVSCIFDFFLAAIAGKIVGELEGSKTGEVVAYGAVLIFPQVWIDSAHWAQCDSIYTFWIFLSLFLYLKERYSVSFFIFGIALSFKLQAIFVLPFFLMVWLIWDCHRFRQFFWAVPGFYVFCVPAILCGRKWTDPLNVYMNQTTEYSAVRFNFPSFWGILFPAGTHSDWNKTAVLLTAGILVAGAWRLLILREWGKTVVSTDKSVTNFGEMKCRLMRLCAWCIWTCVLFLPNMHERYAYSLDILLLVSFFTMSKNRDIPAIGICWLSSLVCYGTARLELPYSIDIFRLTCGLYLAAYCMYSRTLFMRQARPHT